MKTLFCFPGGSAGKESASNMGDLGFIPGLGRYPGGRNRFSNSSVSKESTCNAGDPRSIREDPLEKG